MSDSFFPEMVLLKFFSTIILIVRKSCKKILKPACRRKLHIGSNTSSSDSSNPTLAMPKFLNNMPRKKPIKLSTHQLKVATNNFSDLLGSGAHGSVYKGIIHKNLVAVKVLNGASDVKIKEQFKAEVTTIGKIQHPNLVRLLGFCYEKRLKALVYEYQGKGSLDKYLFREKDVLGFKQLHDIAVGTAKGIAYLHEECKLQQIIHYDIKPANILLDVNFCPKVADFGLAKLSNKENNNITMSGWRGTAGYAAPEIWMPFPVTHKCDVYSFGMLLFEILGRRRNLDVNSPESQEWFPKWAWKKFEKGEMGDLVVVCGIEEKDREMANRILKIALYCIQHRPDSRPLMSVVVQMLEETSEVPTPSNPFQSFGASPGLLAGLAWDPCSFQSSSSLISTESIHVWTKSYYEEKQNLRIECLKGLKLTRVLYPTPNKDP